MYKYMANNYFIVIASNVYDQLYEILKVNIGYKSVTAKFLETTLPSFFPPSLCLLIMYMYILEKTAFVTRN